ncbi:hypothetical protein [Enterococcus casseliflavus]|uniref:hypothetical protein n=1 Tax=Enterococcus casseliflavus TaxID=37734 RepID=UPI003D0B316D
MASLNSSFAMDVQFKVQGNEEWTSAATDSAGTLLAGTTGEAKKIHALKISLVNQEAYDIYYQVHVQNYGWLDWAENGEETGFVDGLSKRALKRSGLL